MEYTTTDSTAILGGVVGCAVSIPVSSLPSLVTSGRCSLYPVTHELLFPSYSSSSSLPQSPSVNFLHRTQSALLPTQALPWYAVVWHQPQLRSPSSSHCRGSGLPGTSSPTLLAALEMMYCSKRERWGVCDKNKNPKQKKRDRGKTKQNIFYYT